MATVAAADGDATVGSVTAAGAVTATGAAASAGATAVAADDPLSGLFLWVASAGQGLEYLRGLRFG